MSVDQSGRGESRSTTINQSLATIIGTEMVLRKSPGEIAREVRFAVQMTLLAWAEEADDTPDAPWGGGALRWAADEFGREHAPAGRALP